MVMFIVKVLFSVWTVAYNFVPGGEYTREHTDWLMAYVGLTLALSTVCGMAHPEIPYFKAHFYSAAEPDKKYF